MTYEECVQHMKELRDLSPKFKVEWDEGLARDLDLDDVACGQPAEAEIPMDFLQVVISWGARAGARADDLKCLLAVRGFPRESEKVREILLRGLPD